MTHRAEAEIDLAAITRNLQILMSRTATPILAVVKADAYGHGLLPVAQAAVSAGAKYLGVALLEEAITLRKAGITAPVIAWLTTLGDDFSNALRADVEISISSTELLRALLLAGEQTGIVPRIHLEVDTGLSRGGVLDEWDELVSQIVLAVAAEKVILLGFWSHFARADEPGEEFNELQREVFEARLSEIKKQGLNPKIIHLSNSAASINDSAARFDLLRIGIALYGLSPEVKMMGSSNELGLTPAMTLKARFHLVKKVPAGSAVGYGSTAILERDTYLGVVAMGYADGIPRNTNSSTGIFYDGERAPIIGRVSMDQFVVNLGERTTAKTGDLVTVFGAGNHGEYTADDWAIASGTINYEIVTRIGPRVPRIFQS